MNIKREWLWGVSLLAIAIALFLLFFKGILEMPCGNFDVGKDEASCVINCREHRCGFFNENGEEWCKKICQEDYHRSEK